MLGLHGQKDSRKWRDWIRLGDLVHVSTGNLSLASPNRRSVQGRPKRPLPEPCRSPFGVPFSQTLPHDLSTPVAQNTPFRAVGSAGVHVHVHVRRVSRDVEEVKVFKVDDKSNSKTECPPAPSLDTIDEKYQGEICFRGRSIMIPGQKKHRGEVRGAREHAGARAFSGWQGSSPCMFFGVKMSFWRVNATLPDFVFRNGQTLDSMNPLELKL